MKTTETRTKWMAIALFYVIAVITRAIVLRMENPLSDTSISILWGWAEGLGPCFGAIAAVLIYKRKFYCSITGRSLVKSLLTLALPFTVCFLLNRQLSFILLAYIFYSFLEEVGWRGYLQGELAEINPVLRVVIITLMWFFWHITIGFNIFCLIFLGILLLGSWGIGIIARDSRSLMACACFHTLGNFSMKGYFEFTPSIITLYVAIFIIWHLIWYVPWARLFSHK